MVRKFIAFEAHKVGGNVKQKKHSSEQPESEINGGAGGQNVLSKEMWQ